MLLAVEEWLANKGRGRMIHRMVICMVIRVRKKAFSMYDTSGRQRNRTGKSLEPRERTALARGGRGYSGRTGVEAGEVGRVRLCSLGDEVVWVR